MSRRIVLVLSVLFLGVPHVFPRRRSASLRRTREAPPSHLLPSVAPTVASWSAPCGPERAIEVDGILDEPEWQSAELVTGFVQMEPRQGEPATERTVVRVAYDDEYLFVAAYCYDSQPDALVVNDLRQDFNPDNQDAFQVILDTFADRRNGYVFIVNPEGAKADWQVANEGREVNTSWEAPWSARARRVADGWTAEIAVPFRALRFDERSGAVWGVNFARSIRRKNEEAFWSPIPRSQSLARLSVAGNLKGLPASGGGRDLRAKPYVAGSTVRETGGADFSTNKDIGLDVKYGLTKALTLDVTLNPEFAQAEADEQQVRRSKLIKVSLGR